MKFLSGLMHSVMVAALAVSSTAAHAEDGITRSSVVLGQSVALTGPGSSMAQPFHQGAKMYFDRINAAGGVNGRKIELITFDDCGTAYGNVYSLRPGYSNEAAAITRHANTIGRASWASCMRPTASRSRRSRPPSGR